MNHSLRIQIRHNNLIKNKCITKIISKIVTRNEITINMYTKNNQPQFHGNNN